MQLDLKNRPAVIIGGASGIGLAIARAFAEEGAVVGIIDRSRETEGRAGELAAEFGVRTCGIRADTTDFDGLEVAADRIAKELGPLEHIVFAAGIGSGKFGFPFWNLSVTDWDPVLQVNLLGAVNAAHVFAPRLVEIKRGTMLFISSVAGQIGSQTDPPYSATKAAMINYAQVAAKDLAPHNVRVNTICPGMVKTPLNWSVWEAWHKQQPPEQQRAYEDWAGEKVRKVIPLGRWQEPEDIAALAVFLASDKAKNITGQTMNVDGGWVMR